MDFFPSPYETLLASIRFVVNIFFDRKRKGNE